MGNSTRCSRLSLMISIALMAMSPSKASYFQSKDPITLRYYLHGSSLPGTETDLLVASASGNLTSAGKFDDVTVFNSPLRKTRSRNSTLLGNSGGTIVDASHLEPLTFFISFTAELNTTDHGGTFSARDKIAPLPAGAWDLAVVGGTGAFRGARGYAEVFTFPVTVVGYRVLRYTIHMFD